MKQTCALLILTLTTETVANTPRTKVGSICHVEAEYYYPGTWEKYTENELICNYWKFLSNEDKAILETQLDLNIDEEYTDDEYEKDGDIY